MGDHDSITHYAVLVGINDYSDQPPKSAACVAREAQGLLDSKLRDCVKIYSLIADRHNQNLPAPAQGPASRPTCENFVRILNTIVSVANSGSFVYIHSSGHGTQKTSGGEKEPANVGLVLLNEEV